MHMNSTPLGFSKITLQALLANTVKHKNTLSGRADLVDYMLDMSSGLSNVAQTHATRVTPLPQHLHSSDA